MPELDPTIVGTTVGTCAPSTRAPSTEHLWAELRGRGYCATVEPNQSLANAAICDRLAGHDGWCEGYACGPAAAERPGRHRWKIITYVGAHHDDF